MKFKIWQNCTNERFFADLGEAKKTFPKGFLYVADVETDDINKLYELTNNIRNHWYDNDGVEPYARQSLARSTSVGDVAIDENDRCYLCCTMGWLEF